MHPTATAGYQNRVPRTDAWVYLSVLVTAASFAWTFLTLGSASANPCYVEGECWGAIIGSMLWFWGQLLAAIPIVVALGILVSYASRGNRFLPVIGLSFFVSNVFFSIVFIAYLKQVTS